MRRPRLSIAASLVGGAAVIALLAYGLAARSTSRTFDDDVAHGVYPPAPSRMLPRLGGAGDSSLAAYRGEVVVLNFWASWCPPCQSEAPMLETAQRTLQAHDATILGVTYNDATPDSESFVHRYGLTYPDLRDVGGHLAHAYGTVALPESFVIDRHG
ncbi:MAG TPA: TlpA disulfide reductase family protein, partial [Solirubrobacteraceae bacterium]|nr:TlpA disulfide reductase family protein [Solirubrobacteraceae bacterium]